MPGTPAIGTATIGYAADDDAILSLQMRRQDDMPLRRMAPAMLR